MGFILLSLLSLFADEDQPYARQPQHQNFSQVKPFPPCREIMPSSQKKSSPIPKSNPRRIYQEDLIANPNRLEELIDIVEKDDRRSKHCNWISVTCDTGNIKDYQFPMLIRLISKQSPLRLDVNCDNDPSCAFVLELGDALRQITTTIKSLTVTSRNPVPFLNRVFARADGCDITDLTLKGLQIAGCSDIARSIGIYKSQISKMTISDFDFGGKALESLLKAISCFCHLEVLKFGAPSTRKRLNSTDLGCIANFLNHGGNRMLKTFQIDIPIAERGTWAQEILFKAMADHVSLSELHLELSKRSLSDQIYYGTLEMSRSKKKTMRLFVDDGNGLSSTIEKVYDSKALLGHRTVFDVHIDDFDEALFDSNHRIEEEEYGACLANLSSKVPLRISETPGFFGKTFLEQLLSQPGSRVLDLHWPCWYSEDLGVVFSHAEHFSEIVVPYDRNMDYFPCPKEITSFLKRQARLRVFHVLHDLDFSDWNSSDVNEVFAGFAAHEALEHLHLKCSLGRKSFTAVLAFFKELSCRKGGRLDSIYFYCLFPGEKDRWNWSQLLLLISLTADRLTYFSVKFFDWNDTTPIISDSVWSEMVRSLSRNSSITELHLDLEGVGGPDRCFKDKGLNEMICRNRGKALYNDLRRIPKNLWSHRIKTHLLNARRKHHLLSEENNSQVRPFDSMFSALTKGLNEELCEQRPRKRQHGNHSTEIHVGKNE